MLARATTISLAVQFLLAGYCVAQTSNPGAVRVGDRWTYDVKDDLTGDLRYAMTVVIGEINDKEITTRVSFRGKDRRPQTMAYDLDWGRIDDGGWKLRPSGIGIKKPLQVGKEWRSDSNAVNLQSRAILRATGAAKVADREQVTTPAGKFDTFRVNQTVRMINTNDQTISQTWDFVLWYAPAINRWVRRKAEWRSEGRVRDSYSEELTEYSRKP